MVAGLKLDRGEIEGRCKRRRCVVKDQKRFVAAEDFGRGVQVLQSIHEIVTEKRQVH